jgi:hypothetical protein
MTSCAGARRGLCLMNVVVLRIEARDLGRSLDQAASASKDLPNREGAGVRS